MTSQSDPMPDIRFYRNEIDPHIQHITSDGTIIYTTVGEKPQSEYDFKVKYKQPGKRHRTPRHTHVIVDLYLKQCEEPELVNTFVDHVIDSIIKKVAGVTFYPPALQVFDTAHISKFEGLSGVSEYSVEFLLVVIELIMIQERTNYPTGDMTLKLFENFRSGQDIFSVISAATFR